MLTGRSQKALLALLMAGAMLLSAPTLAQPGQRGGDGAQRGARMMQRLSSELNLSAEQESQLKSMFEARRGDMKQYREQMQTIFTDQQRAALKEMRKNRKSGDGQRPSKEAMRQRMQEIGVTPEQMAQMRELRGQIKAQRESMNEEISSILTPEQQSKFQEMRKKWKGKRGNRGGGRRGEFRNRRGQE